MASKRDIKEWQVAGYEYAADQLCDWRDVVPRNRKHEIEGCAMDLMGGNDEAAAFAVEGMRKLFEEKRLAYGAHVK